MRAAMVRRWELFCGSSCAVSRVSCRWKVAGLVVYIGLGGCGPKQGAGLRVTTHGEVDGQQDLLSRLRSRCRGGWGGR